MGGDTPHVLVVEDESGLIDLFEIWLSDHYAVTKATTGEAALSTVDESVDVMILDWRLPDRSGGDIVAAIADRGLDPAVVVVTGAEPDSEAIDEGVDLVLQKPIDKDSLLAALDDLFAPA